MIYDDLGVERFKNGILVDSFTGHSVGEVRSQEYLCAINKEARTLRPRFASYSFNYVVSALNGAVKKDDLIHLPYSTDTYLEQPFATNSVNLNPYQVFLWNGMMSLDPATDNWVDTQTKPDVVVNLNGENDIYTSLVNNVNNPASVGVQWNDWQTVVKGVTVNQNLTNQISTERAEIDGKTLDTTTSTVSSSIATTTGSQAYRTGIQLASSAVSTVERSLGTKVTDISIVPYIRSRLVKFKATGLKPLTRLYASFDNVDVTSYCGMAIELVFAPTVTIPSTITSVAVAGQQKNSTVLLVRKNVMFVITDDGNTDIATGDAVTWSGGSASVTAVNRRNTLFTNDKGDVAGTFVIPNNDSIRFTTGEKAFRLADSLSSNPSTAAEVKYVALGMSQSLERSIVATRVATVSVNPVQETGTKTSQTVNSTVASTASSTLDVTVIPEPTNVLASKDEDSGDFGVGIAGKFEYNISYDDSVIVSASGTASQTTITVSNVIGISIGMVASGTGIGAGAAVTNIAGNVVTLSVANSATVSGTNNVTFTNVFEWIGIKYTPTLEPVRYTMYFDGKEYTTGFVGDASFNDRLVARGLPRVTGAGSGKLFFKRANASLTRARLVVESPFETSEWQFVVPNAQQSDPSVTLPPPSYSITVDKTVVAENDVAVS